MSVNVVKYSTSSIANATLVGSVAFGWDGYDYGPSSISGWYNGVTPPSGGYVIYATSASQIISATVASNDTDLITIGKQVTGQNFTSSAQVQTWMNANGYAVATTVYSASGDLIRAALTPAYTASYDAATVGNFIQVDSASYNNVFTNLSATKYVMNDTDLNSAASGWSTGYNISYDDTINSIGSIPINNYIIGYAYRGNSAAAVTTYLRSGTTANGTHTKIGANVTYTDIGAKTVYFIRKAPTTATASKVYLSFYMNGTALGQVSGKSNYPIYFSNGIDTNTWTPFTGGYPTFQALATTNKQW